MQHTCIHEKPLPDQPSVDLATSLLYAVLHLRHSSFGVCVCTHMLVGIKCHKALCVAKRIEILDEAGVEPASHRT